MSVAKKYPCTSMKRKSRKGEVMLTRIACCIKSIAIKRPNNSPATRVNRLIIEQAPKTASKKSKMAVHTQTLHKTV